MCEGLCSTNLAVCCPMCVNGYGLCFSQYWLVSIYVCQWFWTVFQPVLAGVNLCVSVVMDCVLAGVDLCVSVVMDCVSACLAGCQCMCVNVLCLV